MSFTAQELAPVAAANWSYQMVGRLKPGVSAEQAQSDAEAVAQEIMRNYPAMMANLHISAMVRPLQQETTEAGEAAAADAVSGGGGGAADCVREPGRTDAGAGHQAAARSGGAAGAGSDGVGAAAPGDSGEPGAERERRSAGIDAGRDRRCAWARACLPESLPRISEIGLNWSVVGFALLLARGDGLGVRAGSGVCGAAHQRERESERRRQERVGRRRPCAPAFDAGGRGDCDCAGAADGVVPAAAQL